MKRNIYTIVITYKPANISHC